MAKLQLHRAHESLNTQSAADWQVQAVNTVSSSAEAIDVSGYHNVHIMTDNDLYFSFQPSSTDVLSTANDLYLMGGDTIYSLRIPHGLSDTVNIQLERKGSSDCAVRMVLS